MYTNYQVNGQISVFGKIKCAFIDEIDFVEKVLWVTDEDGEVFEVPFGSVDVYLHP